MNTQAKLDLSALAVVLGIWCFCLQASGAEILGWRMDGTGRYPDANPPTYWSKDTNIIWSVPFDHAASYSSPVLIGDKVITTAGPALVVCLDAKTGKQIWATPNHVFMDILEGDELDRANEALKDVDALHKERRKLQSDLRGIRRNPDDQRKRGLPWAEWSQERRDAEIARMLARVDEINGELEKAEGGKYVNAVMYRTGRTGDHGGPADATPVTDGKRLYMQFDSGVVVCLDVETGRRLWYTMLTGDWKTHHHGDHSSPCLIGDRLVVTFIDALFTLDANDGSVLWKNDTIRLTHGTPFALTIDGTDIVTVNERFFRVADGKELADIRDPRLTWGMFITPVVEDEVMFLFRDGPGRSLIRAVKLPKTVNGDVLDLEILWAKEMKGYKFDASPLVHNGLLYNVSCIHAYTHQNRPRSGEIWVMDAKTGETVYVKDMSKTHLQIYNPSSPTLAGPYIYVNGGHTGKTVIFVPGRTYEEVAVNELQRQAPPNSIGASSDWMGILSTPVFEDDRMYVRHSDRMYCIGGDARAPSVARTTDPEPADSQTTPRTTKLQTLPLLWKVKVQGACHAPITAQRGIVVIADHVEGRDQWKAFAAADGRQIWSYEYENKQEYDFGPAPRAAPLFNGHEIICLGASGRLLALHLPDGKVRWEADYLTDFLAPKPIWGFCSSPLIHDDRLIANPGGEAGVVALDPRDGTELWEVETDKSNYANFVVTQQGNLEQVVGYDQKSLRGFSPVDGKTIWKIPIENPSGYIVPVPTVIEDKLLLIDGNTGARLHRFDENGVLSETPMATNEDIVSDLSSPFVQQDFFLIGNAMLTCADAESLEVLWTEEDEESFQADILHIVSHDRKTLVFSQDGHALVIRASREGCKILGKARLSDPTYVRPAISGSRLFARDESYLYCYELRPPW